jgi:hypothetical protein
MSRATSGFGTKRTCRSGPLYVRSLGAERTSGSQVEMSGSGPDSNIRGVPNDECLRPEAAFAVHAYCQRETPAF